MAREGLSWGGGIELTHGVSGTGLENEEMLADCKHFIMLFEMTPLAESGGEVGVGGELRRDEKVGNDSEESIQGKGRLLIKLRDHFKDGRKFEMSHVGVVVCKSQLPRCTLKQGCVGFDQRAGSVTRE